jgi:hypothetical protein
MHHSTTRTLRAAFAWSLIPVRLIALLLRVVAWILDPNGGAPWNTGPIPKPIKKRH